jgi:hypothetical protein
MIGTYGLTAVLALSIAASLNAQARDPGGAQTPTQPRTNAPSATNHENMVVTLAGCLYRERDVPGRTPNVAERAGVLEDYILADAVMAKTTDAAKPGGAGAAAETTTRSTVAKMYKVENIDDDKLRAMVGKRVEVIGKIDAEPGDLGGRTPPRTDSSIGPDLIELPEFEATSIKEVAGTCPATPSTSR